MTFATAFARRNQPPRPTPGRVTSVPGLVWRESRPAVQLVFGARYVAGMAPVHAIVQPAAAVTLGGWLLVSIAIYVFNGVSDLRGDRFNGSARPLASGRLGLKPALASAAACSVAGISLCATRSVIAAALALAFAWLGWCYSDGPTLKSSACAASTAIGGGAALSYLAGMVERGHVRIGDAVFVLLMGVWIGAASNAKDLTDRVGDALAGRHTLPVRMGPRRSAVVIGVSSMVAACAVLTASVWLTPSHCLFALSLVAASAVLATVTMRAVGSTHAGGQRDGYRIFMAIQYAANVALALGA